MGGGIWRTKYWVGVYGELRVGWEVYGELRVGWEVYEELRVGWGYMKN